MNSARHPINPLDGAIPNEVPLERAPLVCVLAQVKFSEVLNVERPDVVATFQDAIVKSYGVLTREEGAKINAPAGVLTRQPMTHWRFADAPREWQWRVSLTSQFVTLEVRQYTSRTEFFDRLQLVLEAVQAHIKPQLVLRLGVRYINRLVGQELNDAAQLVRPEVAGVVGTPMSKMVKATASETTFDIGGGVHMGARWGLLPPNAVIDAKLFPPVDERCFMLDLDVFDEAPIPFEAEAVAARAKEFARRSYAFFRWAVTPEFLARFGGKS